MDLLTETFAVILIISLILAIGAFVFLGMDPRSRVICHAWKIRSDGVFEAETNFGIILFRRKDIQLIESHNIENTGCSSVCIGNLQRMVWIEFPSEAQAHQFVSQMNQHLAYDAR
jgi:hypothetical protein